MVGMESSRLREMRRSSLRRWVSRSWFSVGVLLMAALAGCSSHGNPCPVHRPDGLRSDEPSPQEPIFIPTACICSSADCEVSPTPVGFVVEPYGGGRNMRNPFSIAIGLQAMPPEETGYRVRYAGSGRLLWHSGGQRRGWNGRSRMENHRV